MTIKNKKKEIRHGRGEREREREGEKSPMVTCKMCASLWVTKRTIKMILAIEQWLRVYMNLPLSLFLFHSRKWPAERRQSTYKYNIDLIDGLSLQLYLYN